VGFTYSPQQKIIFDTLLSEVDNPVNPLITISAIAGASKTTTLVESARLLNQQHPNIRINYLVFGTAAAAEAKAAFGTNATVSTLHKLAHDHTIKAMPMVLSDVSFFSYRHLPASYKESYHTKVAAIELFNDFCDSPYVSIKKYIKDESITIDKVIKKTVMKISNDIVSGKIHCLHSHYLKVFHILLSENEITLSPSDILLIDECQDLSPITAAVIEKFPAKLKVLVGDEHQSIFGFLGTVNAFEIYPKALRLQLTRSFRLTPELGERVEAFCTSSFAPSMEFIGANPTDTSIKSTAYITRTNASLISKMIALNESGTPYQLATQAKIQQMFELPLALIRAISGKDEHIPKYRHFTREAAVYRRSEHLHNQMSCLTYIARENDDNPEISQAIQVILNHSPKGVIDAYNSAKAHKKTKKGILLCTAHTSKGKTLDEVTIADDLNDSVEDIITKYSYKKDYIPTEKEHQELMLYYVAITRAKYSLLNAVFA